jgi:glycosyltransferase involved in cell wall biosynthesis
MSPPRVAFVLTQDRGGPVDVCVMLAGELDRRGAEVALFGPRPARGAAAVEHLLRSGGVDRKGDLAGLARFRREIAAWGPEVVHAQDRRSGLVIAGLGAAARALGRPAPATVHTYHGVPDDVGQEWFAGTGGPAPSRYTRTVLAADAVVTRSVQRTVVPSESMAGFLARRLRVPAARMVHIDNGVPLPSPAPPGGPVRELLFVGLLVERKGVVDLLRAMSVPGAVPADVRLTVAGDGPARAEVEDAARPLGDRVRLLGFREDVPELLAKADALVLPSRMEQQPLVVAEAMAAGKPVLATDCGGVAEMLDVPGAARYLARPGDIGSLADALRLLLTDDDPARTGAALARAAHARFSPERATDRHLALYDRFLHPTGARAR